MADPANPSHAAPTVPSIEGVTKAERYLARLCKRSFLSLWSYPSVYRDQGRLGGKVGDGKEVCDLLVVFENHVIIFSDKDCKFGSKQPLEVEWPRWYKRAVRDSAKQIWGAERWIKEAPNKLFLDRQCTFPFPIKIPDPDKAIFHRIVVAHDAARACAEALGGSGSLMIQSHLEGDLHFQVPFTIGRIEPSKGYVHVFDDTSLNIVMSTLDTITDFVTYLTKKERFLTGNRVIAAAGEEELLAIYLRGMNAQGERDFTIEGENKRDYDTISLEEGFWEAFARNPQRLAQIESDKISYSWDELIEKFLFYAMAGTQYHTSGRPLREQEIAFRFMAKEPRFRRRVLATALHDALVNALNAKNGFGVRVIPPSEPAKFACYVFLFLKRRDGISDEKYRLVRMRLLSDYCKVTKLTFPQAIHIVGIATEAGLDDSRSEDLVYMDTTRWSGSDQAAAQKIQDERGFLKKVTPRAVHEYEYPVDHKGRPRNREPGRNSPCTCGSGKRYKRCHGASIKKSQRLAD